jgi:hypothetical protein
MRELNVDLLERFKVEALPDLADTVQINSRRQASPFSARGISSRLDR